MRTLLLSLFALTATPALADTWSNPETLPRDPIEMRPAKSKQNTGHGFGIGAENVLTGLTLGNSTVGLTGGGLLMAYDGGLWRVDGLLGLVSIGDVLAVRGGGRVLIAAHQTERADFSLGAGGYVLHASANGTVTRGEIDLLAQLRVFLVENVALQAGVGVGIIVGEGDALVAVGGQLAGSFGLVYYF